MNDILSPSLITQLSPSCLFSSPSDDDQTSRDLPLPRGPYQTRVTALGWVGVLIHLSSWMRLVHTKSMYTILRMPDAGRRHASGSGRRTRRVWGIVRADVGFNCALFLARRIVVDHHGDDTILLLVPLFASPCTASCPFVLPEERPTSMPSGHSSVIMSFVDVTYILWGSSRRRRLGGVWANGLFPLLAESRRGPNCGRFGDGCAAARRSWMIMSQVA